MAETTSTILFPLSASHSTQRLRAARAPSLAQRRTYASEVRAVSRVPLHVISCFQSTSSRDRLQVTLPQRCAGSSGWPTLLRSSCACGRPLTIARRSRSAWNSHLRSPPSSEVRAHIRGTRSHIPLVQEGVFLEAQNAGSAYAGWAFHQPPVVLGIFVRSTPAPTLCSPSLSHSNNSTLSLHLSSTSSGSSPTRSPRFCSSRSCGTCCGTRPRARTA